MTKKKIGVIAGSLRKDAYSKAIAALLSGMMPGDIQMCPIEIGTLPLYNEDLDEPGSVPGPWTDFREAVRGMDGFLFVTPEYNRSFPAAIKNALDVGSRPWGENLWEGKPGAVVGVTPGRMGAFGAVNHLRQVAAFLDIRLMQQPEAYIGEVDAILQGRNPEGTAYLKEIAGAFAAWVERG